MKRSVLICLAAALAAALALTPDAALAGGGSWWPGFWARLWPVLLKIIAVGSLVLLGLSVLVMLITFRRAKKISPLSLIISMLISLTALVIYSGLMGVRLPAGFWLAALAAGAVTGAGWSLMSRLVRKDGLIKAQGNAWHLAVWAAVFAFNQLTVLLTGRPAAVAMVMLLVSTGLVLGNSGAVLARYYRMRGRS